MVSRRNASGWLTPVLLTAVFALQCPGTALAESAIFEDGFESGDSSVWSDAQGVPRQAFRFSSLALRDPHVFVVVPVFGCQDATDDFFLGLSFNDFIQMSMTEDDDLDGLLDLSLIALFKPFNSDVSGGAMQLEEADCSAPISTMECEPKTGGYWTTLSYDGLPDGPCLEPFDGTTSSYTPAIAEPVAPCFVTWPGTFVFTLIGLDVPLRHLRIAATTIGDPPTGFVSGLLMGFVSETDADGLLFPGSVPLIGDQPLSSLFPGGTDSCSLGDDRDSHGEESGWWLYFNFEADQVPY